MWVVNPYGKRMRVVTHCQMNFFLIFYPEWKRETAVFVRDYSFVIKAISTLHFRIGNCLSAFINDGSCYYQAIAFGSR